MENCKTNEIEKINHQNYTNEGKVLIGSCFTTGWGVFPGCSKRNFHTINKPIPAIRKVVLYFTVRNVLFYGRQGKGKCLLCQEILGL